MRPNRQLCCESIRTPLIKPGTCRPAFPRFLGWQTPVVGGCLRLEQSDSKMCDVSGAARVKMQSKGAILMTYCNLYIWIKMRWWPPTCRTWPSEVMFNKLASSSYTKERDRYLIVLKIYICVGVNSFSDLWNRIYGPWRQYVISQRPTVTGW